MTRWLSRSTRIESSPDDANRSNTPHDVCANGTVPSPRRNERRGLVSRRRYGWHAIAMTTLAHRGIPLGDACCAARQAFSCVLMSGPRARPRTRDRHTSSEDRRYQSPEFRDAATSARVDRTHPTPVRPHDKRHSLESRGYGTSLFPEEQDFRFPGCVQHGILSTYNSLPGNLFEFASHAFPECHPDRPPRRRRHR